MQLRRARQATTRASPETHQRKEANVSTTQVESTDIDRDDRVRGAIWGLLVGDAAALGTHWIYDLEKQSNTYPAGVTGFEEPFPGHYHHGKRPGEQTHYGDGALLLLESIAERGAFDPRRFGAQFVETFRQGVYSGYIDHATHGTVERYDDFIRRAAPSEFGFQDGADDDQPATQTRLAVLVGRYHRVPQAELLGLVESLTLVTQHNAVAVASAKLSSLLIAGLIDGASIDDALSLALERTAALEPGQADLLRRQVSEARAAVTSGVTEATLGFGQSCPLEHSLPASLQVLLKYPDDYETAVLEIVRAGGDNAARAGMVGSWLGAHLGVGGVPERWRERLTHSTQVSKQIDTLINDAG
jgi:ADP-ribosyl-[dinitrogen reductase] hydrolase